MSFLFFFFNDPAPTEIYTLSLHDALPICRAHRRALAGIERAELDAGAVSRPGHGAAQRVDLAHQVSLADAADGRIATHLAQGLDALSQQQRARSHACGGEGRLGAGMTAADDDDVVGEWLLGTHGMHG